MVPRADSGRSFEPYIPHHPPERTRSYELHEVLFSLNIGFAITFSLLFITEHPGPTYSMFIFWPAGGLLLRSALKVDQLLHLDTVVSTGGLEIISVGLISLVAVCAFLFLRLVGRTAYARAVVPPHGPPEEIVQPFLKWMHGGSSEPRDYIILVDL